MANEMQHEQMIPVEVAYALPERQRIIALQVRPGTTALQAARESGITREFPDLDLDAADMGIFAKNLDGKLLPAPGEYVLQPRDRVEIYRPLLADPKAVRKQRAAKARARRDAGSDEAGAPEQGEE